MQKVLLVAAFFVSSLINLPAEWTGYPAEEFIARRKALASALGDGTVVLFGNTMPAVSVRFRQDNDFYYFTGNEDLNAVFVMDAETADSWLFLRSQNAGEIRSDGKNWLCPGPALESLATLSPGVIVFVVAMAAGMVVHDGWQRSRLTAQRDRQLASATDG